MLYHLLEQFLILREYIASLLRWTNSHSVFKRQFFKTYLPEQIHKIGEF